MSKRRCISRKDVSSTIFITVTLLGTCHILMTQITVHLPVREVQGTLSSDRACLHVYFRCIYTWGLEAIRVLSFEEVQLEVHDLALLVLPLDRLPLDYLHQLCDDDRTTAYRASCIAWAVTGRTLVPRELQLRSCLATHNNQDSLICGGAGSGKTLPIALAVMCYLTTQLMDPFEVQDVWQIGTFPKELLTKMPVGLGQGGGGTGILHLPSVFIFLAPPPPS